MKKLLGIVTTGLLLAGCSSDNGYLNSTLFNRILNNIQTPKDPPTDPVTTVDTSKLIARYLCNGNAADSSGNNYHGTNIGGVSAVDRFGKADQAMSLQASGNYLDLGDYSALNFAKGSAFTIISWVKTLDQYGAIVSFRNSADNVPVLDLLVGVNSTPSRLVAIVRNDATGFSTEAVIYGSKIINDGNWHQVALTRDEQGLVESFVDGVSQGTAVAGGDCGSITTNIRSVGFEVSRYDEGYDTKDNASLNGSVDDIRIYKKALSSAEITELYKNESPVNPTAKSVEGCWKVNQTNGNYGTFSLHQNGTTLTGFADWDTHGDGTIAGTVTGNKVDFTITYDAGLIGSYTATISSDGLKLDAGYTYGNNGATANWTAEKISCVNITGCWKVTQFNGFTGTFEIQQNGTVLTGFADWNNHGDGTISGTITGDQVKFTITYAAGLVGTYNGTLSSDGLKLSDGNTVSNMGGGATWEAEKIPCVSVNGCWKVTQYNGFNGTFTIQQNGTSLTGYADWYNHGDGTINGAITDNKVEFDITYDAGLVGTYTATLSSDGLKLLSGTTISNQGGSASWDAVKAACEQQ